MNGPRVTPDDLMRYLDGELTPEERTRVDGALAGSTELQREVAIYRALKADFQELSFHPAVRYTSVWDRVNARVTRPIGWLLVIAGTLAWLSYGVYVFATSPSDPWEKLATGAVAIGILILFASVIWERYQEWLRDPYRDVHR
jgi:anti-sigma factor RsiW